MRRRYNIEQESHSINVKTSDSYEAKGKISFDIGISEKNSTITINSSGNTFTFNKKGTYKIQLEGCIKSQEDSILKLIFECDNCPHDFKIKEKHINIGNNDIITSTLLPFNRGDTLSIICQSKNGIWYPHLNLQIFKV